ncbi:glutamine--fructose-6-phosphate transaminase (isomerizing) [Wolbachia endosymbiont of Pentidionis agamae]|uniref:glutamine--fructose-6-phosphate transaminase (isomerizing) n=1 Tax=Wolbachia endosymbiont of Pentidionis agamae TaxID=3110435 RepID=UPI002FCF1AB7
MCGIFGVVSSGNSVVQILLSGLQKLEYRGYDSSGIAVISREGEIEVKKSEGKVERLFKVIAETKISSGAVGIAHTRWATHGPPNLKNAHPVQTDSVAVAHNGIIENYNILKRSLERKGVSFQTETDTEVIPNMLTLYLSKGLLPITALMKCLNKLHGSFALVILLSEYPDTLFVAKRNLPLAIGYNCDSTLAASDFNTLNLFANRVSFLKDNDIAIIKSCSVTIYNNGVQVERNIENNNQSHFLISKNGYSSFMLKEIFDQPCALSNTIKQFDQQYKALIHQNQSRFSKLSHITIVGCGSSYFAGLIAKYWLESIAQVRVYLEISSEFRYSDVMLESESIGLFISQSGETADTIEALRYAKAQKQFTISLTNTENSSIERMSDMVFHTIAGPEIGVASTKTFLSQLAALVCFTLEIATIKGISVKSDTFPCISKYVEYILHIKKIEHVSNLFLKYSKVILMGRGTSYGVAMEGALKIKELSYINTIGIAAGEMKHGSIALIDENVLVVAIIPYDNLFFKTLANVQEIITRKGKVIAFTDEQGIPFLQSICEKIIRLPKVDRFTTPIIYIVAMQLLAYFIAVKKGLSVDYPRNLAKSVTVE